MPKLVEAAMLNLTTQSHSKRRECCLCGDPLELEPDSPRWRDLDVKCKRCADRMKQLDEECKARDREAWRVEMLETVPKTFLKTEREKLPHPEKLDEAMAWKFGPQGLLLYGPTGCGKSRVAWEVAKREMLDGRTLKAVNAFELCRYPSLFMESGNEAGKFADSLVSAKLLLLDDVFKAKPTERVEELLFSVIDERGQWEKPCIVTLNDTGDSLTERLSSDRGPALIRRLREYCRTIQF
jgi:hypothetical protein